MKKTLAAMLPYIIVLTINFYLLPYLIRNTATAMLIMLFVIPLISFICAVIYGFHQGFGFSLPIISMILFAPTIFIYYNSSAWLYIVVYGIIAFIGISVGCIFYKNSHSDTYFR